MVHSGPYDPPALSRKESRPAGVATMKSGAWNGGGLLLFT